MISVCIFLFAYAAAAAQQQHECEGFTTCPAVGIHISAWEPLEVVAGERPYNPPVDEIPSPLTRLRDALPEAREELWRHPLFGYMEGIKLYRPCYRPPDFVDENSEDHCRVIDAEDVDTDDSEEEDEEDEADTPAMDWSSMRIKYGKRIDERIRLVDGFELPSLDVEITPWDQPSSDEYSDNDDADEQSEDDEMDTPKIDWSFRVNHEKAIEVANPFAKCGEFSYECCDDLVGCIDFDAITFLEESRLKFNRMINRVLGFVDTYEHFRPTFTRVTLSPWGSSPPGPKRHETTDFEDDEDLEDDDLDEEEEHETDGPQNDWSSNYGNSISKERYGDYDFTFTVFDNADLRVPFPPYEVSFAPKEDKQATPTFNVETGPPPYKLYRYSPPRKEPCMLHDTTHLNAPSYDLIECEENEAET